jgi:hypothetical protein
MTAPLPARYRFATFEVDAPPVNCASKEFASSSTPSRSSYCFFCYSARVIC